ncbi:hypothetical protein ACFSKW_04610 [Nonomuraea mangrovi]|uniref:HEAT repeat domain-containing protein n=1 Tax=Nonomuraea mangrovi TaxID=2316207 RepID=A0ABW4SNT3_9ACTN
MNNGADPFAGLDEVRWSRMRHAYGSAVDVPDLLRGLVHPDPAERETALDGMYAAVHHQGDVYPCTVAVIPFLLRIAERSELPGRPEVVRLLADIGSAEDPEGLSGPYRKANQAVAAAYPLWERLLEDADPRVREAAAEVLPACVDRGQAALACLTGRLTQEGDTAVRTTIVRTVGTLARRAEHPDSALRDRLVGIVAVDPDPRLRLVALAELASLPGAADVAPVAEVGDALEMVAAVYRSGTPVAPPAGFETDTLTGAVRRLREQQDEGRRAPQAAELVSSLSLSFSDRVDDRVRLLAALLRSPDWECRLDALWPAGRLIEGWRGDYGELVKLIAGQVHDGHARTRPRAVSVLRPLGAVAAPAADALAKALTDAPVRSLPHTRADERELPWVIEWPGDLPTVGPALEALSGTGDARALPMLAWVLDREPMPRHIGSLVIGFGPRAAPLVPLLRRRLRDLCSDNPHDHRRDGMAFALAAIGPAAAPALPDLLAGPLTPGVLRALVALAPEAPECLPVLCEAAAGQDRQLAVPAAKALWQVSGDADIALSVAGRCLDNDSEYAWQDGTELLAALGPAAKPHLARLRRLARRKDPYRWLPLSAARALWRATGDPAPVLPALEQAWTVNVHTRRQVASLWAEIGPAAADARRLLSAELGRARRHNVSEDVYSSAGLGEDEELLRLCRTALAAVDGTAAARHPDGKSTRDDFDRRARSAGDKNEHRSQGDEGE